MLTFDAVWHFGEVFSSRMNPGFHCTGQMADSMYGVMCVSGLLMSTLWIEWPMVAVGLWYGQAYVMDNEHRRWYPEEYGLAPQKKASHRALEDIQESIKELKFYRANVFKVKEKRKVVENGDKTSVS
ncbi:Oligoribonuclease, mitochondrial [Anabarilius grahami]|uniref:Oligoribonuclease, mitochondrial n=1 Tax=Anabarilius grahami TaxID=495550 RepID=A0A3N0Z7B8_ANAGA|nr:Oligoribonuclease, mitochondrial [Anabarilius grahami]